MGLIAEGISAVREEMRKACERASRDPGSVRLIAVSKTKPLENVREAAAAGQRAFGENYAQELRAKGLALPELEWHFLGALQTNKVKLVLGLAALVHTCDRLALAEELSKRAGRAGREGLVQRVLLEVNLGREPQKGGVLPEESLPLLRAVLALPGLRCEGLMCIPPEDPGSGGARSWFRALRMLRDELQQSAGEALPELSMGMSADYNLAIEEGATLVRVGTAIFGARDRPAAQ